MSSFVLVVKPTIFFCIKYLLSKKVMGIFSYHMRHFFRRSLRFTISITLTIGPPKKLYISSYHAVLFGEKSFVWRKEFVSIFQTPEFILKEKFSIKQTRRTNPAQNFSKKYLCIVIKMWIVIKIFFVWKTDQWDL